MLNNIIADKRKELAQSKKSMPLSWLEERISLCKPVLDFSGALRSNHLQLITEVKHASPSRGTLIEDYNPVQLAKAYSQGGAAAISVLTEQKYFRGSLEHLSAIRAKLTLPLLRKDFIFDPYQVYESRAYGADALLLIAAILSRSQLEELLSLSHSLGLKCLVEIHHESEIEKALINSSVEVIGINNRDLSTFTVDINTTRRLRPLIPANIIVVSESGIQNRNDIYKLKEWRVDAALIGEALVTASDISSKMKELLS
jgi:indole-3-glycerol phosphate synthase